jgi:hypothetical protein
LQSENRFNKLLAGLQVRTWQAICAQFDRLPATRAMAQNSEFCSRGRDFPIYVQFTPCAELMSMQPFAFRKVGPFSKVPFAKIENHQAPETFCDFAPGGRLQNSPVTPSPD